MACVSSPNNVTITITWNPRNQKNTAPLCELVGEAISGDARQRDIELGKKIPTCRRRAFYLVLKLCINGGNCAIW
jgi:hypothetical protein